MKVESRSGQRARAVLTGMIVSRRALARIAAKWAPKMFDSVWENTVGQWCVDFYRKYDDAPGKQVVGLFEAWSQSAKDKESIKLIERYLQSIDDEYDGKEINVGVVLDYAGDLFNNIRLRKLAEGILEDLDDGRAAKAQKDVIGYLPVEVSTSAGVDVFLDKEASDAAFENRYESIIDLPGALGQFMGNRLRRGGFIAFEGKEKVGKSWWLMFLAYYAMRNRRRVAFFEVGDMTQDDMFLRWGAMAARKPIEEGEYKVPTRLAVHGKDIDVDWNEKECKTVLSAEESRAAMVRVQEEHVKSSKSYLRLVTVPAGSMSVLGIQSTIDGWAGEGWVPDVIVIDYADLLAPVEGKMETRDQINHTWMKLRALSQIYHALTITATQADANSYTSDLLDMSNFSNDKRKLSHVTGMIGINQNANEQEMEIQRLNWIVGREGKNSARSVVYVAGCLAIGNPAVRSAWPGKKSE